MKVIILHRYFWPQAYPYAQMLKDIAEKISSQHDVSVLTTDSGDISEKNLRKVWAVSNNIDVQALSLGAEKRAGIVRKIFNSLYFGAWIFYKLFFTKTDVVMVATTPPIVIAMIVRWVSYFRKFKYIYHCQDIHPEAMLLGGNIQESIKYNVLLNIDKKNVNKAWKVITLSEDMKRTLLQRGCKISHVEIINNFIFDSGDDPIVDNVNRTKMKFLFAGSLGRLQNLQVLMESLVLLKHREDMQFIFMGDGIMYKEMVQCKKDHKLDNVKFLGQRSLQEAVTAMHNADIGIVSIGSNISSVAYPSKTMMYLGNGLPVLALVDKDTQIYTFIKKEGIGEAIAPLSAKEIANAIEKFVEKLKKSPIDKMYVKNIAEATFGKDVILPKFMDLYYTHGK